MKDAEKQPYIGIGTPIVNYHMTHRIFADGTVLEIMDHKILDSVAMGYYGGIQYQQKANTFDLHFLLFLLRMCLKLKQVFR